jgi:hypothetical protein
MSNSNRGIIKDVDGTYVIITVALDSEVYTDRKPGPMHPETEAFIQYMDHCLNAYRRHQAIDKSNT